MTSDLLQRRQGAAPTAPATRPRRRPWVFVPTEAVFPIALPLRLTSAQDS